MRAVASCREKDNSADESWRRFRVFSFLFVLVSVQKKMYEECWGFMRGKHVETAALMSYILRHKNNSYSTATSNLELRVLCVQVHSKISN